MFADIQFLIGPFRFSLRLEMYNSCCYELFYCSDTSYRPMRGYFTPLRPRSGSNSSMASRVIDREFDTQSLDEGLKNVWKWERLGRKVGDELIGRFISKNKN